MRSRKSTKSSGSDEEEERHTKRKGLKSTPTKRSSTDIKSRIGGRKNKIYNDLEEDANQTQKKNTRAARFEKELRSSPPADSSRSDMYQNLKIMLGNRRNSVRI